MGKTDISLSECLQDKERYADCFNTALCSSLVQAEQLTDMERILEGTIPFTRTVAYYKKERDGVRGFLNKKNLVCAIVCLENQKDINYAEVVTHLIYDAYGYNRQLIDIRKKHEQEGKTEGGLRGFTRTDRLLPVLTVCVYYGDQAWDAPLTLHELMDFSEFSKEEENEWKKYVQNYRIYVLDIRRMSDEQIESMTTDMKLLFGLLKNADDKEAFMNFVQGHQELTNMRDDIYQAFASLTNAMVLKKLKRKKDIEGGIRKEQNVCKAINDLIEDGRQEGIREGIKEGIREGELSGKQEGLKSLIHTLKEFLQSPEEIWKRIVREDTYSDVTLEEVMQYY